MGVKFTRSGGLKGLSQRLLQDVGREMGLFGSDAVEELKNRTVNQSRDVDGNTFKPYSKGYQRFKAEKTKVQSAKVNLTLSGDMIRSIVHEVLYQGSRIVVRIFSSSNYAAKKIEWNSEARDFFGISKSEEKRFANVLTKVIGRLGQ